MTQTAQSAACNHHHPIESLMARWLLMANDRMKWGKIQITEKFLANMIGVRREAVNKTAKGFQKRGLISYNRRKLVILDLKGLRTMVCEYYKVISKNHPQHS
jgi:CRP-like cAMP-binding protein